MKANQSERDMVDAIRNILGLNMLYEEEPQKSSLQRYHTDVMKSSEGTGNRKVPLRDSTTKTTEMV